MIVYPNAHYIPLHCVYDFDRVRVMVDALRRGERLPSIPVFWMFAMDGTHRLAAYEVAGMTPITHELDAEKVREAVKSLGYDFDTFLRRRPSVMSYIRDELI